VRYSIDEFVAEGDKVVNRYTMEGTHNRSYMGIPATGKRFVVKGVEINRIADREIVEVGVFPDIIGMMTQLGVVHGATPKT
jgi:predicted ester cyclase